MNSNINAGGKTNEAFELDECIKSGETSIRKITLSKTIGTNESSQNESMKSKNVHHGFDSKQTVDSDPEDTIFHESSEEKLKPKFRIKTQIVATVICATLELSFGAVFGFTGTTLPALTDEKSDDIVLTLYQASWFSSVASLGAIAGGILSSFLTTIFGQRVCLLIVLPFGVISSIVLGMTNQLWILLFCRIIQGGVAVISSSCSLTYIAEISHKSIRGRLIGSNDVSRQLGFLLVFIMGSTNLSWRTVAIITGVITMVVPFIGFMFLPNSPRWLVTKGRTEEATKALTFFMGENYDSDSEMKEITEQITQFNSEKNVKLAMFLNKFIFTRLILLTTLVICVIYTGNFVILMYSVFIFESANVTISSYMSTIVIGCLGVVGTIIYLLLVDKIGRKPLLIVPSCLAGICMTIFGLYFYLMTIWNDMNSIAWLPLVSMLLYSMFICISMPVVLLYMSELLPTPIRPIGTGFLYTVFSTSSFVITLTYANMVQNIGSHWTFWIFGANCFLIGIISALFIPETLNMSLEQTGEVHGRNN